MAKAEQIIELLRSHISGDDRRFFAIAMQVEIVIRNRLHSFKLKRMNWNRIQEVAEGLSHAEITRACDEAAKQSILSNLSIVTEKLLLEALQERKHAGLHY